MKLLSIISILLIVGYVLFNDYLHQKRVDPNNLRILNAPDEFSFELSSEAGRDSCWEHSDWDVEVKFERKAVHVYLGDFLLRPPNKFLAGACKFAIQRIRRQIELSRSWLEAPPRIKKIYVNANSKVSVFSIELVSGNLIISPERLEGIETTLYDGEGFLIKQKR